MAEKRRCTARRAVLIPISAASDPNKIFPDSATYSECEPFTWEFAAWTKCFAHIRVFGKIETPGRRRSQSAARENNVFGSPTCLKRELWVGEISDKYDTFEDGDCNKTKIPGDGGYVGKIEVFEVCRVFYSSFELLENSVIPLAALSKSTPSRKQETFWFKSTKARPYAGNSALRKPLPPRNRAGTNELKSGNVGCLSIQCSPQIS